jgi:phage-related protein
MPVVYPFAPFLIPGWENPQSFQTAAISQRKNGGTEQRGNRYQINQSVNSYNIQVRIAYLESYEEIDQFLKDRNGSPFFLQGYLYRSSEHRWVHIGGEVWELSLQLEQVYRP